VCKGDKGLHELIVERGGYDRVVERIDCFDRAVIWGQKAGKKSKKTARRLERVGGF
jgi:hypothetical protein